MPATKRTDIKEDLIRHLNDMADYQAGLYDEYAAEFKAETDNDVEEHRISPIESQMITECLRIMLEGRREITENMIQTLEKRLPDGFSVSGHLQYLLKSWIDQNCRTL